MQRGGMDYYLIDLHTLRDTFYLQEIMDGYEPYHPNAD